MQENKIFPCSYLPFWCHLIYYPYKLCWHINDLWQTKYSGSEVAVLMVGITTVSQLSISQTCCVYSPHHSGPPTSATNFPLLLQPVFSGFPTSDHCWFLLLPPTLLIPPVTNCHAPRRKLFETSLPTHTPTTQGRPQSLGNASLIDCSTRAFLMFCAVAVEKQRQFSSPFLSAKCWPT